MVGSWGSASIAMAGVLLLLSISQPPATSAASAANEAEDKPLSSLADLPSLILEKELRAFERSLALPGSLSRVLILAVVASSATSASEAPVAAASSAVASVIAVAIVSIVVVVTAASSSSPASIRAAGTSRL